MKNFGLVGWKILSSRKKFHESPGVDDEADEREHARTSRPRRPRRAGGRRATGTG